MLDPGWMVERTAKQLVDKLEQARRQQVPTGRTSGRRLLRLWPRRLILPTAFCPYHRLVLISCGFSIVFGSVLSISIYYVVLLLAAGSEVMAAGDMDWLNQYRYGAWGSHARLGEGWDGMHSTRSLDSDLVVSFDNDLGGPGSISANSSVIFLHRPRPYEQALKSCEMLNETLWDPSMHMYTPLDHHMSYLETLSKRGKAKDDLFWISHAEAGSRVTSRRGDIWYHPDHHALPVICTNSAPHASRHMIDTNRNYQVIVDSNYERYIGYRDKRSFRFLGMRYAATGLKRWEYSVPNVGHKGKKGDKKLVDATDFGDICPQMMAGEKWYGSEDCLTLDVYTPFLPIQGTKKAPRKSAVKLKPVMVWIHGGSLIGGAGGRSPANDGGNLASRGDIVVVTLNYRLGTLGFMSLKDDDHTFGNFGLRDIATAIRWIRDHIHDFGGDKEHITLVGQSAGGAAVRALLASGQMDGFPPKIDKAIMMSTPGGLGHMGHFSKYHTWKEAYNFTGKLWEKQEGFACKPSAIGSGKQAMLDCMRNMSLEEVVRLEPAANKFVMDGDFLSSTELRFARYKDSIDMRHKPKIMVGWMRDDGANMIRYPEPDESIDTYLNDIFLPNPFHSAPKLFAPSQELGNTPLEIFKAAVRISTNLNFRCAAESTAFNAEKGGKYGKLFDDVYVYEFDRSFQLADYPSDGRNHLCRPEGNRNKSTERYLKCHSGELKYVFGNLAFLDYEDADGDDYNFSRMILDTWASFIRTGNPNLNADWLRSRGYHSTLEHVQKTKMWRAIGVKDAEPSAESTQMGTNGNFPGESVRILDWPSRDTGWRDLEQCYELRVPLEFYRSKEKDEPRYGMMGQRIDGVPGETVW